MIRSSFFALVVLTLGCSVHPRDTVGPPSFVQVQMTRITPPAPYRQASGIPEARYWIADAATLARLWERFENVPVPEVDFEREIVLVAAMGTRPTGGYSISIEEVGLQGDFMVARVRSVSPGAHCVVSMSPSAPVDIVKVPYRRLITQFEDTREVRSCVDGIQLP
jgi:hypothetical protein